MNPTAKDHELADHIRTLRALGLHGEAIAQHPLVARHPSLRPNPIQQTSRTHNRGPIDSVRKGPVPNVPPGRPVYAPPRPLQPRPLPSGGAMAPPAPYSRRPPVRPLGHISSPPRFNFAAGPQPKF